MHRCKLNCILWILASLIRTIRESQTNPTTQCRHLRRANVHNTCVHAYIHAYAYMRPCVHIDMYTCIMYICSRHVSKLICVKVSHFIKKPNSNYSINVTIGNALKADKHIKICKRINNIFMYLFKC